jgi:transcriptional regulator with XRE-family HTH domain
MENNSSPTRRKKISDRLKQERRRLCLNQTNFGAIAGVSKTTQVNYESGERTPDADYLADIAEQVDVLYVLTGKRVEKSAQGGLDEAILLSILEALEIWEGERGERVDVATRARLISIFYSHALSRGGLEQDWMRQTFRMVK